MAPPRQVHPYLLWPPTGLSDKMLRSREAVSGNEVEKLGLVFFYLFVSNLSIDSGLNSECPKLCSEPPFPS